MTRSSKRSRIRAALDEEARHLTYEEREVLVRCWMARPYSEFADSIAAGYIYPDADNPNLSSHSRLQSTMGGCDETGD